MSLVDVGVRLITRVKISLRDMLSLYSIKKKLALNLGVASSVYCVYLLHAANNGWFKMFLACLILISLPVAVIAFMLKLECNTDVKTQSEVLAKPVKPMQIPALVKMKPQSDSSYHLGNISRADYMGCDAAYIMCHS